MKLAPRTKADLALAMALSHRCDLKAAIANEEIETDPNDALGQLSFIVNFARQLADIAEGILVDLDKANGRA